MKHQKTQHEIKSEEVIILSGNFTYSNLDEIQDDDITSPADQDETSDYVSEKPDIVINNQLNSSNSTLLQALDASPLANINVNSALGYALHDLLGSKLLCG